MLLAIDAGNTTVCFAVFPKATEPTVKAQWYTYTRKRGTPDEWGAWLVSMLEKFGLSLESISSCIISCVVPDILEDLKDLCLKCFGQSLFVVGDKNVALGIEIKTDDPSEVGADLLAATVAAKMLYHPPVLILGMGTATTLSLVDREGNFAGVAIAPGIDLSIESLYKGAANLPSVSFEKPRKVIGTTTVPCIQAGVYWGTIGLVEGLIDRAQKEYGEKLPVIATGGYAEALSCETKKISVMDLGLVLKGLQIIYKLNHSSKIEAVA